MNLVYGYEDEADLSNTTPTRFLTSFSAHHGPAGVARRGAGGRVATRSRQGANGLPLEARSGEVPAADPGSTAVRPISSAICFADSINPTANISGRDAR